MVVGVKRRLCHVEKISLSCFIYVLPHMVCEAITEQITDWYRTDIKEEWEKQIYLRETLWIITEISHVSYVYHSEAFFKWFLGDYEGDTFVSGDKSADLQHVRWLIWATGRRTSGGSPFGQTHNSSGGGGHFWPLGNQNIFIDKMLYISQFPPSVLPILRSVTTCFCLIVMKGNI